MMKVKIGKKRIVYMLGVFII